MPNTVVTYTDLAQHLFRTVRQKTTILQTPTIRIQLPITVTAALRCPRPITTQVDTKPSQNSKQQLTSLILYTCCHGNKDRSI